MCTQVFEPRGFCRTPTSDIDECTPLDGSFHKAASYSTNADSATHDTAANASRQNPQATAPRVMTDRELLLSLHQKVDSNHKWEKRQFGSILQNMTITQNSVKKNHYYLHEVFDRNGLYSLLEKAVPRRRLGMLRH